MWRSEREDVCLCRCGFLHSNWSSCGFTREYLSRKSSSKHSGSDNSAKMRYVKAFLNDKCKLMGTGDFFPKLLSKTDLLQGGVLFFYFACRLFPKSVEEANLFANSAGSAKDRISCARSEVYGHSIITGVNKSSLTPTLIKCSVIRVFSESIGFPLN